ncbi:SDR family NAD(P)-dependent oxidoreductase, partial [Candidatus Cyanaurora vandensis]|uniref:SDR family NAD(P)-dependent oxidoreductase n=1 Tax=Candidatus Cyanaurora vandensis TaxID=2714958 RepID=UPI00257E9533
RTGYPADMLGLDQDMEAELGIDSIKRVEIFGALQKSLPEPFASQVQEQIETFTRVKTLNGVVESLITNLSAAPPTPALTAVPVEGRSLGESEAVTVEATPRYRTLSRRDANLKGTPITPKGLYLITADQQAVAPLVAQALQQQGAIPVILTEAILADPEQLIQQVQQLKAQHGSVSGIVHLAPLAALEMPTTLADWRRAAQIQSKSLFQLVQHCVTDLRQAVENRQGQVIAASLLGGYLGREQECGPGLPLAGSNSGILKTLRLEWPGMSAKTLDFDRTLTPEQVSGYLMQELLLLDAGLDPSTMRTEIGYPQGQRTLFDPIPADIVTTGPVQITPAADWVVLVTGGARGITAEIAAEIAVPGLTLVLAGLSPEPPAEDPSTVGIEDVGQLRKIFMDQFRAQGIGPKPVEINRKVSNLSRDRAIRQNLAGFRQAGAKVEYHGVDVRNEAQFGDFLEGIYQRHGRLDAVIHGAGIIEDKLIIDKTAATFNKVFDTKVDSAFVLSRHLRPAGLKFLFLFGSVAGTFGNPGQVDYAAANEVVNRLSWQLDYLWPDTRVVVVNWGPWDVTGMASDAVNEQFKARGVIPIPPLSGRRFFREDIRYGHKGDTELLAGTFAGAKEAIAAYYARLEAEARGPHILPLLPAQPEIQPNGTVALECTMTVGRERYLMDHRIDGNPIQPAAGAMEWMAEFVQAAFPEWTVAEVQELRVLKGITVDPTVGKKVRFTARAAQHASAESLEVAVDIQDAEKKTPHYRMNVILKPQLPAAPPVEVTPLGSGEGMTAAKGYREILFHGKVFQLLTQIDRINEDGVDAQAVASRPQDWLDPQIFVGGGSADWLLYPGLVDASLQASLLWLRFKADTSGLPTRFGAIVRYGSQPITGPLTLALRVKFFDTMSFKYDAVYVDQQGYLRLALNDIEGGCTRALNRLSGQATT